MERKIISLFMLAITFLLFANTPDAGAIDLVTLSGETQTAATELPEAEPETQTNTEETQSQAGRTDGEPVSAAGATYIEASVERKQTVLELRGEPLAQPRDMAACRIGTTQYTTLADAIAAAVDLDLIEMLVPAYTISETQLITGKQLTIQAAVGGTTLTAGADNLALLEVAVGAGLTLSDITLTGDNHTETRGIINRGNLTLQGTTLTGFQCGDSVNGVALYSGEMSSLRLEGSSLITDCRGSTGAAIGADGANVTIAGTTTVSNCTGVNGGVIDIRGGSTVVLTEDSVVENNIGLNSASAVTMQESVGSPSSLTLQENATIKDNTANGTGTSCTTIDCKPNSGILHIQSEANIMGNASATAGSQGASAIVLAPGVTLEMTGGSVASNTVTSAAEAPGIYAPAGSIVKLSGNVFISNNTCNGGEKLNLMLCDNSILHMTGAIESGSYVSVTAVGNMDNDDVFGVNDTDVTTGIGRIFQDTNHKAPTDLFGMPSGSTLVWDACTLQISKITGEGVSVDREFDFRIRVFEPNSYYQVVFSLLKDLLQDPASKAYSFFYEHTSNTQLDSTGVNYGRYVKEEMIAMWPELADIDFFFSVDRYYKGGSYETDKFRLYFSEGDADTLEAGDTVPVYIFDTYTGAYQRALGLVSEKNVEGTTIKYIERVIEGSETPVVPLADLDATVSLKNGEMSEVYGPYPYGTLLYRVTEEDAAHLTQITVEIGNDTVISQYYGKQVYMELTDDFLLRYHNILHPSVSLSANSVEKELDGEAPGDVSFTFQYTPVWAGMNGTAFSSTNYRNYLTLPDDMTATNDAAGHIVFGAISILQAGDYIFKVTEQVAAQLPLYVYDTNEYYILVSCSDPFQAGPVVTYYTDWDASGPNGLTNPIPAIVFYNYSKATLHISTYVSGDLASADQAFEYEINIANNAYPEFNSVINALIRMLQDPDYLKGSNSENLAYTYFYTRSNAYYNVNTSLDSLGQNYGQKISAQLETVIPGLTSGNYSWKIARTSGNSATRRYEDETYDMFFCETNLDGMNVGDVVAVNKFDTGTGETTYGTARLVKNAQGILVFDNLSFQEDSFSVTINRQDGQTEALTLHSGDRFSMKHGETATVTQLGPDAEFSVVQDDYRQIGYMTSVAVNQASTTVDGTTAFGVVGITGEHIQFVNFKSMLPPTGVNPAMPSLLWSIIIPGAGLLMLFPKKKHRIGRLPPAQYHTSR